MKIEFKIVVVLMLMFATVLNAQNIDVKSFRKLRDSDARISYPKEDQNGEKCAIVKVSTSESGFKFEGDATGITDVVRKVGEYWVYVSEGAKRLVIKHNKLGVKRYVYSEPIQGATSYELLLHLGKIKTTVIDADLTEYITIESTPSDADVYIDNVYKGVTPYAAEVRFGEHNYRVEKDLYHNEVGAFLVEEDKGFNKSFELKPNFGYLHISSTPEEGATISIDGKETNLITPAKTKRLKSGTYSVTLRKNLYSTTTKKLEVKDNEVTKYTIDMDSKFGSLMITSEPSGADISIDGENISQVTPYKLDRLISGSHTIKLRKEWYAPSVKRVVIKDGIDDRIKVVMKPTFGFYKLTTLSDADIYINGEYKAKSEYSAKLVAGSYVFEAKLKHHDTDKRTIKVMVGDDEELSLQPTPIYGSLKVNSKPFGADVFIDGENRGKTPMKIRNILEGDYDLKMTKSGYGAFEKSISIVENKATEIFEELPQGEVVTINSSPEGAGVYIDSELLGETPLELSLSFGNHFVRVKKDGKVDSKSIKVRQNGANEFNFNVERYKDILFKSAPVNGTIYIDDKKQGSTGTFGKSIKMQYGEYSVKVVKGEQSDMQTIYVDEEEGDEYVFDLSKSKRFFITSNSSVVSPYGVRLGITVGTGFYVAANFSNSAPSFDSGAQYDLEEGALEVSGFESNNPYYYKSNDNDARVFNYTISAGLTSELSTAWFLYYGGGYGVHHRLYDFNTYNYDKTFRDVMVVKDLEYSLEGVVAEAGFIIRMKHIALSIGWSTIKFKKHEAKFGLGIYF